MQMRLGLTAKIGIMVFVILVISISGVALISTMKATNYLVDLAKTDLRHMTGMARDLCQSAVQQATLKARGDAVTASAELLKLSEGRIDQAGGNLVFGDLAMPFPDPNQFTGKIKKLTGSDCNIYLINGNQAKMLGSSAKDANNRQIIDRTLADGVLSKFKSGSASETRHAFNGVGRPIEIGFEPIRNQSGTLVGAIAVMTESATTELREKILSMDVGETGYIYTIDSKAILQIHPTSEGKDLSKYDFIREITSKGPSLGNDQYGWIEYPWERDGVLSDKIVAYTYLAEWDWIVATGSYLDEFTAPANEIRQAIIIFGFVFLLISLTIGVLFSLTITKPIASLVSVADAIAEGDTSSEVNIKSKDEVGDLGHAFKRMIGYLQDTVAAANTIASKDLTVEITPRSDRDALGHAFKTMVQNLSTMVRRMKDNAGELVSAATEVASSSEQMSRGASNQTDQVTQVSTAIEEMTATIVESSKNSSKADTTATQSGEIAGEGARIVSETIQGMQAIADVVRESGDSIGKLAKSADEIGEIVGVIDDIADQTNLLALNAAIEAARAGEQGRGFAVVADEVRKLAERTGKATGEITGMIQGIQRETNEAVASMDKGVKEVNKGRELADKAGVSLNEIVNMSQQVVDMIQQIATAAEEQSSAAEQISQNVEMVATIAQESATGAEQSAAAAEELNRNAEGMQQMVAQFKIKETESV